MWVRVAFAFALALGVGCAGKSRSSSADDGAAQGGDGGGSSGTSAGGSSSGGTVGVQDCNDERRAVREFINQNKSCSETSDCITTTVGCGITEDDCTAAVYMSASVDREEFEALRAEFIICVATYEGPAACSICDRVQRPAACVGGQCIGSAACALEAAALWDFKSRNDACEVDDDCVTEIVGCEVTEDDCTGGVYFASDFDREEFTSLRDEYLACTGGCGACRRLTMPPACVSGHCAIRPLR